MSDSNRVFDYLCLVLVPVAKVFRSRFQEGSAQFCTIRSYSKCRVKFTGKRLEREWQEFCKKHDLKNDSELEY